MLGHELRRWVKREARGLPCYRFILANLPAGMGVQVHPRIVLGVRRLIEMERARRA